MTTVTQTYDDEQWQLVPKKPDRDMRNAGLKHTGTVNATYRDMLAAAPTPEPVATPTVEAQSVPVAMTNQAIFEEWSAAVEYGDSLEIEKILKFSHALLARAAMQGSES